MSAVSFSANDLDFQAPESLKLKLQSLSEQVTGLQDETKSLHIELQRKAYIRDVVEGLAEKTDKDNFGSELQSLRAASLSTEEDLRRYIEGKVSFVEANLHSLFETTVENLDNTLRKLIDKEATQAINAVEERFENRVIGVEAHFGSEMTQLREEMLAEIDWRLRALRHDLFRELSTVTPLLTKFTSMHGGVEELKKQFSSVVDTSQQVSQTVRNLEADIIAQTVKINSTEQKAGHVEQIVMDLENVLRASADEIVGKSLKNFEADIKHSIKQLNMAMNGMRSHVSVLQSDLTTSTLDSIKTSKNLENTTAMINSQISIIRNSLLDMQKATSETITMQKTQMDDQLTMLQQGLAKANIAIEGSHKQQSSSAEILARQQRVLQESMRTLNSLSVDLNDTNTLLNHSLATQQDIEIQLIDKTTQLQKDQSVLSTRIAGLQSSVRIGLRRKADKDELEEALSARGAPGMQSMASFSAPVTARTVDKDTRSPIVMRPDSVSSEESVLGLTDDNISIMYKDEVPRLNLNDTTEVLKPKEILANSITRNNAVFPNATTTAAERAFNLDKIREEKIVG
ncbi:hypothetical protein PCE1_001408 [Barthelona sp. PCE]